MSRHTKTSLPLMMLLIFISVQLLFSCVHALPEMEEYDFVDNNTSDVDASTDNGVHSDFFGQQYGSDGVYNIVTEADTGSNVTLDLYIYTFDDSRTGWTRHGTDPYLHIQNHPTDYVWLGLDRTSSVGDFGFQNSSKSSETINSAVLRVYAWKEETQDNFWVYLWDNSSWGNAYNVTRTSAGWTDFDVTARLNTWIKIDSAKIYLTGDTTQAKNYRLFADCVMLRISYATVKSHLISTPIDWGSILLYVLPIILGVLSLSVIGIVLKRRRTGSTPLDFDYFDEMVAGGIPNGYSVMIVGNESSGKSVLCQQLVHAYLNKEKPCIYITYDCFPDEIRKNMINFNLETSSHEQKGIFKFIDCYSSAADVTSEEENFVDFPFSLSDLGIAISEVVDQVTHKSTKIFLDSTAPIFTRLEPSTVIEFLQDRSAKIKGNNGNFFYTVGKGTVPPALMPRLKEIVDCIIELDFEEKKGATSRRVRVRKLRNRRYVNTWVSFKIKPRKGIVFLPFENSAKRYKQKEQSNPNT